MAKRFRGDFKLRGILRRIGATMESDVREAMVKAANLVLETQKSLIPVDTGAGRDALTAFVSKSGLDAQIGIRGKRSQQQFYYLRFVEYGTKGSRGGKKKVNRTDGRNWFGYTPDVPPMPAHPFIRPSYDLNRDEIRQILSLAISNTLSRAARAPNE